MVLRVDRAGKRADTGEGLVPEQATASLFEREVLHELWAVLADGVSAMRLRPVERTVGEAQERIGVGRVRHPADADRDREAGTPVERLAADGVASSFGHDLRLVRVRLREQQRELVAADASRDVVHPQHRRELVRDCLQYVVTDLVAEACRSTA